MTTLLDPSTPIITIADLLRSLGDISPDRIRLSPTPGTATEGDVDIIDRDENRLYELLDGVLVEKVMGFRESLLAVAIAAALKSFVQPRKLGVVSGADGMVRLFPGMVRIPDVAYISRERLPGGQIPTQRVPAIVPDLAVEIISESNTDAEMARKLKDYFRAGVRLVWFVSHETRTARVYTTAESFSALNEDQDLDGGIVLPGFTMSLRGLFAELTL